MLKAALVFGQEALEVIKEHPIENGALGLAGTIDTCHSRSDKSRKMLSQKIGLSPFYLSASGPHIRSFKPS
jgi:hypothetical protein